MKAALTEIATKFLSLGPEARMEFITKLADSGTAPQWLPIFLQRHRDLLKTEKDSHG